MYPIDRAIIDDIISSSGEQVLTVPEDLKPFIRDAFLRSGTDDEVRMFMAAIRRNTCLLPDLTMLFACGRQELAKEIMNVYVWYHCVNTFTFVAILSTYDMATVKVWIEDLIRREMSLPNLSWRVTPRMLGALFMYLVNRYKDDPMGRLAAEQDIMYVIETYKGISPTASILDCTMQWSTDEVIIDTMQRYRLIPANHLVGSRGSPAVYDEYIRAHERAASVGLYVTNSGNCLTADDINDTTGDILTLEENIGCAIDQVICRAIYDGHLTLLRHIHATATEIFLATLSRKSVLQVLSLTNEETVDGIAPYLGYTDECFYYTLTGGSLAAAREVIARRVHVGPLPKYLKHVHVKSTDFIVSLHTSSYPPNVHMEVMTHKMPERMRDAIKRRYGDDIGTVTREMMIELFPWRPLVTMGGRWAVGDAFGDVVVIALAD